MLSVEETNAMLDKEFAQQNSQGQDLPLEGESKVLDETMQTSSVTTEKAEEIVPGISALGSDQRPLREIPGQLFPTDSHETDENAKKFLAKFSSDSNKRNQNPSLLLDDLRQGVGDVRRALRGSKSYHYAVRRRTPSSNDYENDRDHFE